MAEKICSLKKRGSSGGTGTITMNIGEYGKNSTASVQFSDNKFSSFKVTGKVGTINGLQYATSLVSTNWIDITLNQDYDVSNLEEFKVRVSAGNSSVDITYATFVFN